MNVKRRVTCKECRAVLEYDDKSVWEGNRDREDVVCPKCQTIVDHVFTDSIINVVVIEKP